MKLYSGKVIALLLAIAMLATLATACVQSANPTTTASTAADTTASAPATANNTPASNVSAEEPTTISLMTWAHMQSPLGMDIETFKILGEKLNISIDFQTTAMADYDNQVNLVLASGNLPDIMAESGNKDSLSQYYGTDTFIMLDDYIKNNVSNFLVQCNAAGPLYAKNIMSDDGHFWYFTKIEYSNYNLIPYINGDWLNEYGLEMPTNTDELYTVLKTFKEKKGDDYYAYIKGPWATLEPSIINYFGSSSTWMQPEEGSYVYGPYQKSTELKNALTWLNKLYAEGIIDKDYAARDDDTTNSMITNGKAGFFITWGDNGSMWSKGGTDGLNFLIPGPIPAPGAKAYVQPSNFIGGKYLITKNAKPRIDKIMEMFQFIYSQEGMDLFSWGIEGETYTKTDGVYAFADTILKNKLGGVNGRRTYGINPNPFPHVSLGVAWDALMHPESVSGLKKAMPFFSPAPPVLSSTPDEQSELTQIMADVDKYVSDSITKFVVGDLSIDTGFDTFIDTLKSMNVERAIEIKQAEYQRWMERGQ